MLLKNIFLIFSSPRWCSHCIETQPNSDFLLAADTFPTCFCFMIVLMLYFQILHTKTRHLSCTARLDMFLVSYNLTVIWVVNSHACDCQVISMWLTHQSAPVESAPPKCWKLLPLFSPQCSSFFIFLHPIAPPLDVLSKFLMN